MSCPAGATVTAEIAVIGGGLGGVAAALGALRLGRTVVLTEETAWLGGQLTSQAVPPDEHPWIEDGGATATYRDLRTRIRDHYRRTHRLTQRARQDPLLNPGQGYVSSLCHEPRIALAVLEEMLAPYRTSGRVTVLTGHRPVAATTDGDRITAVRLRDDLRGAEVEVSAPYVIDATELGDLLELAGVEHVTGAESRDDTGELHAVSGPARPLDQQAVSWCFAMEHRAGEDHTIDQPAHYGFWRGYRSDFWSGPLLSWADVEPHTLRHRVRPLVVSGESFRGGIAPDLWNYRRIASTANFVVGALDHDVTLVNWPQIDYWLGPIVGVPAEVRDRHLAASRELSRCFLYWMQTEAPRHDGGQGYPGLRLRGDLLGTDDGLAMAPYIRESRRIRAEVTVTELDLGVAAREVAGLPDGSTIHHDTVGVGSYRIDLHPSVGDGSGPRTYVDIANYPFQVPLGALLPIRVDNLLPASKNIGTTHITNGCYRLHPVEWNIGEVAGTLAAHCLDRGLPPRAVHRRPEELATFQSRLAALGVQLAWPETIRTQRC